jgi:hypothetical protein
MHQCQENRNSRFIRVTEKIGSFHGEEENDDYIESEVSDFANISPSLQLWLQPQDGLKTHGLQSTSRELEFLESVFSLLARSHAQDIKQLSTEDLTWKIAMLYITKIT